MGNLAFISGVFVLLFAVTASGDASISPDVLTYIKNQDNVNCMWVDNVGDTSPTENVTFKNIAPFCIEGRGGGTGLCEGTIRCTGVGSGWGDIYFENVSCVGSIISGNARCGLTAEDVAGSRGYSTGVKSCLDSYLGNSGNITEVEGNQAVQQINRRVEVSQ